MRRRKLIWTLFPPYLLITLAAIIGVTWHSTASLYKFFIAENTRQMKKQAILLANDLSPLLKSAQHSQADELSKRLGAETSTRITAILPDGRVVGDTDEDAARMENHRDRPEVAAALAGEVGSSIRYSVSLNEVMLYVALPVIAGGEIIGVVRVSVPLTALRHEVYRAQRAIVLTAAFAAILAALLSLHISRRISSPLEDIRHGTKRFAAGDLGYRLQVTGPEEIAAVASTLNGMAEKLSRLISEISLQRNQLDGVLSGMSEGVIAIGRDEQVLLMNRSAAKFLQLEMEAALGEKLYRLTRVPGLLSLAREALAGHKPEEAAITLYDGGTRTLRAAGEVLRDEGGAAAGAIIVMREVTHELKLERIRRDFVANVSHELRTPITAIKGFAESLLDGAMGDEETATSFLRTIARHADRLNSIIEDLLTLSRIEQSAEQRAITKSRSRVKPILEGAAEGLAALALEVGAEITISCDDTLEADINTTLLQQAVSNLIDNSVKYAGGKVSVFARASGGDLSIAVKDEGPGIDAEHLDRVFERFYRVDKKASRKSGGTGLGLAIVKHIALSHGGRVDVRSVPGQGAEFSICIPSERPELE